MSIAIITGSAGLIGSESARYFHEKGFEVWGIDNNMRKYFFGEEGSTQWIKEELSTLKYYRHFDLDIRDFESIKKLFQQAGRALSLVIHAAAQPSHDWAAREPLTDFGVNAVGTLNVLEATRLHAQNAVFMFTSTNKVYGDTPNYLPLIEQETRWELDSSHHYAACGIDESMSIDQCKHSLFGASKVAADVLVQEYGRYFGMKTVCFRGGCLTGPNHSGAQLHGFLAYLMKCCVTGDQYTVFGYKGKQVRDNIHSSDLVDAFYAYYKEPRIAEVYNIGGGRGNSCSMLEAISLCEEVSGRKLDYEYVEQNRIGDHIWYISDLGKFENHYPQWRQNYSLKDTIVQIYENNVDRW